MRTRMAARARLVGFSAISMLIMLTLACINRPMKNAQPTPYIQGLESFPQSLEREVDILFVVDNSGSMKDEQENLRRNFASLMDALRGMVGGLPDLHVGVVSTDLGTGIYGVGSCVPGGDEGKLLTGACENPKNSPYIIDVQARGCTVVQDDDGLCQPSDCGPANCEHEPGTTFVLDSSTGCPRCRNYSDESLEDVFSCMADLGTSGCGFEQPLEAMYKALDPASGSNEGFVRETAFLAVVIITDEDDCSASSQQLFDDSQRTIDSTLGPLWSYRCFEFGITCDVNSRQPGQRQGCVPRDEGDPGAMLFSTDRYEQLLLSVKDPEMVVLAAIAGPPSPSAGGVGFDALVGLTDEGYPDLQASCGGIGADEDGAVPAIRIFSLLQRLNSDSDLGQWAFTSICSEDFSPALEGIGSVIGERLAYQCMPAPLKGCSDPGVEFGAGQHSQRCEVNSQCLAVCTVEDVFGRNTSEEVRYQVPPCLEILEDGTRLQGNKDRAVAYAGGHPDLRDPDLPVAACWHVSFEPACVDSNGAEILVARREDPPPKAFAEVSCAQIPAVEELCNDMRDNDENCLVDADDPCCANPQSCR